MLQSLMIRDVVLIKELDLDFRKGLGVLTGETGAGKSILLDSLGLALGERADTALIRKGAEKAQVVATFYLDSSDDAFSLLEEQDIEADGNEIILRRTLTTEGRSKCFVNDHPVTQGFAKQLASKLVEVHGQFDQLLNPKSHRQAVDHFAKMDFTPIKEAYTCWQATKKAYEDGKENLEKSKEREAFLRFSVEELEKVDPKPGEEEVLTQERAKVAHRAKIAEAGSVADKALTHEGVVTHLVAAQKAMERVEDCYPEKVTPLIQTLDRALVEVEEAGASVQDLLQDVQGDSASLESVEDRLHELRGMAKKHHVAIDELSDLLAKLVEELSHIDQGEEYIEDLRLEVLKAREAYEHEAQKLSEVRSVVASKLEEALQKELGPLKLGQACFTIDVEKQDESGWTAQGWDRVEFCVSTNPGTPSGPLNKIASGGELSRLMLALKVVLAQTTAIPTLIFDEIDSGTGGAVAAAIGERLKTLSQDVQLLAITHSPQVAALGDQHLHVMKVVNDSDTTTHVIELEKEARLEELARMLSGAEITGEARAQAKQLMVG